MRLFILGFIFILSPLLFAVDSGDRAVDLVGSNPESAAASSTQAKRQVGYVSYLVINKGEEYNGALRWGMITVASKSREVKKYFFSWRDLADTDDAYRIKRQQIVSFVVVADTFSREKNKLKASAVNIM